MTSRLVLVILKCPIFTVNSDRCNSYTTVRAVISIRAVQGLRCERLANPQLVRPGLTTHHLDIYE